MKLHLGNLLTTTFLTAVTAASVAHANPVDGTVSAGSATISSSGATLTVNQTSNKAVIDWRGFDINAGETTQFVQPTAGSIALNRVNSNAASQINGNLTANGNIIIVNQNGVVFGAGSHVDVNGLVATTSDIDNNKFMNSTGKLVFDKAGNNPNAAIVNNGTITAAQAGLVGLVAPNVVNNGVITAKLGRVHLASGDTATVDMYGDGLLEVAASDALTSQLVSNSGTLSANGGQVAMTAAAGRTLVNSLITNSGAVEAQSVDLQGGSIVISNANTQGVISNTGTLSASGTNGGAISLTAHNIAQQGTIKADGTTGSGGTIDLAFDGAYIDNAASSASASSTGNHGGNVHVHGTSAASTVFASGTYKATGKTGGNLTFEGGKSVKLYAAHADASGSQAGGTIRVGGGAHGTDSTMRNTQTTTVNGSTVLNASATDMGNGGNITVWSDATTNFMGTARATGGANGGNGGLIELSSGNLLNIAQASVTDASALYGQAGQLLLDPKTSSSPPAGRCPISRSSNSSIPM